MISDALHPRCDCNDIEKVRQVVVRVMSMPDAIVHP